MNAPATLAQKLVARAAGRGHVAPGEIVTCRVDLAMFHDSSGPRRLQPMLAELGAQIWDKGKVVLVIDHYVPEADDESRRIVRIARDWAAEQRLPHVYDSQGHLPRGRAAARPPAAGHVLRRRRFAFAHRRRFRRLHVRHRRDRDAGRRDQRRDLAAGARDDLHAMGRPARRRRERQGHDAGDAGSARHERRCVPGGGVLRRVPCVRWPCRSA